MDDIQTRLTETAKKCLDTYGEWSENKKDEPKREALQDAVHELRKVASRLEIEIAISERDEQSRKNIPIPAHRSSQKRPASKKPQAKSSDTNVEELPGFISGGDAESGESAVEAGQKRRAGSSRRAPTRRKTTTTTTKSA